jgi:uncharacterized protein
MKKLLLSLIRFYQKFLSPDHSFWAKKLFPDGYCKFHPTCSKYTYEAIEVYGIWKGGIMGIKRIGRCNPWNPGGLDPVPKKHTKKLVN